MTSIPPEESAEERRARELSETVKQEAEGVSEVVKEEASGITGQAEQRAAELAAERIVQRTEERIEQRADIKGELQGLTAAVSVLLENMEQSLPEDRVKEILNGAKAEEKRSRQKLMAAILGPIVIVGAIAAGAWSQSRANNRQNEDVEVVANYVRHCLQGKTEGLTPQQLQQECGGGAADGQATAVKALFCVLLTQPEIREKSLLGECVKRVQAGEFG